MKKLVIGSRGSKLALWQSEYIRSLLVERDRELEIEIRVIKTRGDAIQNVPLPKIGDKGLFTQEIEEALLAGEVDFAVHSLKDLPTTLPDGLIYAGSPPRADYRDAFISLKWKGLDEIPARGVIATGSMRRKALLQGRFPGIGFTDLRGNIDTRLRKLEENGYDGIIMAAAALKRLERSDVVSEYLDPEEFVPSVSQGAVGVEIREDRDDMRGLIGAISHEETVRCCRIERAFMRVLEGGCSVALGALARIDGDRMSITGFVSNNDGSRQIRRGRNSTLEESDSLGVDLAEEFLSAGARDVLGR